MYLMTHAPWMIYVLKIQKFEFFHTPEARSFVFFILSEMEIIDFLDIEINA